MANTVCELCCLLCCPPWPSKIAEKIAFQPPPPSYLFSCEGNNYHITFIEQSATYPDWEKQRIECLYATTSRGNRIACVFVKCNVRARFTILFSHGNASDLGHMCQFYCSLGTLMGCNIFSYDYSGYGTSSGKPSEKNMYADIDCAWKTLQSRYGVPAENIILYGMSLGTVPSVDLAARYKVRAVILHSPLTSAIRVLMPNTKRTYCWDAFTSIEKVSKITSPVLVIHGTEDEIIPFSHGVAIYEKCRWGVSPLWVGGAGHNDIEGYTQYLDRLKTFVNVELGQYQDNVIRDSPQPGRSSRNKKIHKKDHKNDKAIPSTSKETRADIHSTGLQRIEESKTEMKEFEEEEALSTEELKALEEEEKTKVQPIEKVKTEEEIKENNSDNSEEDSTTIV